METQYYSETVRQDIAAWPVGIRAMYARITERMQVLVPIWGCHLPIHWGKGYLRSVPKAEKALAERCSAPLLSRRL